MHSQFRFFSCLRFFLLLYLLLLLLLWLKNLFLKMQPALSLSSFAASSFSLLIFQGTFGVFFLVYSNRYFFCVSVCVYFLAPLLCYSLLSFPREDSATQRPYHFTHAHTHTQQDCWWWSVMQARLVTCMDTQFFFFFSDRQTRCDRFSKEKSSTHK